MTTASAPGLSQYRARVTWPNADAPAYLDVFAPDARRARFAVVNVLTSSGGYAPGWHIREVAKTEAMVVGEREQGGQP